jgi:CheY-like chemotaxis protein
MADPSPPFTPSASGTVRIVEPEVLALRGCGYKVVEAANGDEALVVLEQHGRIEILFSVVALAGAIDGFGLSKWIRADHPGVQVILAGTWRRRPNRQANYVKTAQ